MKINQDKLSEVMDRYFDYCLRSNVSNRKDAATLQMASTEALKATLMLNMAERSFLRATLDIMQQALEES